jgi:hypothetical protein
MNLLSNKKIYSTLLAGLLLSTAHITESLASPAISNKITGLYSTGVDNNGTVRPTNTGLLDLHYTIVDSINFKLNDARWGYPWLANTATAGWLAPFYKSNSQWSFTTGTYQIQTTFTIADDEDPLTASFSAKVAADNSVSQILLNGHKIGSALSGLNVFDTISANQYFQKGVNVLQFDLYNAYCGGCQNPAGLIVDFQTSSISKVAAVPEPETYALMLAGLGLVGVSTRRRQFI